uniref:DNA-directed DNA polymerase n=1 Tax=Ganoderma boninense TaxID=34458 RepID=A0A5K1K4W9_9APHY|nr:Uncharacterized protein [Ganoderma boninense]
MSRISWPKRNEVGVQLLSRQLHRQVFRNISFPPPPKAYVNITQEHLKKHGLDPAQGSILPDTGFTLPPLQGRTLDEHFYRIGTTAAQPWLTLAQDLAAAKLPPKPDDWLIQSGWTRYSYLPDGSSYSEHVPFPQSVDGKPEELLVFDIETMPIARDNAVMACLATPNAWYAWISPWLLGEDEDPQQLIPLGDPSVPRIVVGHNVSFDRKRILEEYNVEPTQTRFLDTMSLHVAVKGISSHQRGAWQKYRKTKELEEERRLEAIQSLRDVMDEGVEEIENATDPAEKERMQEVMRQMEESLRDAELQTAAVAPEPEEDMSKRWEDQSSLSSLEDVAMLYCGIRLNKDTRNDFLNFTREEIRDDIFTYLDYCASDVEATHAVFTQTLPAFRAACPSPVSFAGILTMGSSLLTVNEEWEAYLANAERTYKDMEDKVKKRLIELAEQAKAMMTDGKWKEDVWLSQLDWTPKVARWEVTGRILPLLLQLSYDGEPLQYSTTDGWHYYVGGEVTRLPTAANKKLASILSATHGVPALESGLLRSVDRELTKNICAGWKSDEARDAIIRLAKAVRHSRLERIQTDPWLQQLDWMISTEASAFPKRRTTKAAAPKPAPVYWPKWYWELAKPKKDCPPGTLDLTVRNRSAPLLLRLSWQGWPLFYSKQHGWTFRVPQKEEFETRATPLKFTDKADLTLHNSTAHYTFYKLPHKDGEAANVGSPLAKTFMKYAQDETLASPFEEAKNALDMNAQCSYWISARDRVMKQMVVWQDDKLDIGVPRPAEPGKKWGIILPQVITMGTVTRRAIEKTWLTASNAKKNRIGSELKAMVRAPPGYSIVGADVDSEELWISSVMGDAQFGLHGATAIGWMTLEGTKAAGTDLHSKTASILGISRDQAKVFNYSRIYGAGQRHAVLLLLQGSAGMLPEKAEQLAKDLYASTKGQTSHGTYLFGRKFWYGGTESFVFNKLEEIALSSRPQTPALGCGITSALSKENLPEEFGSNYMTSRINWVVQSSGVDYLHLLIVSMQHLIAKYDIQARYLISVHDELRYLVKDADRYRAALALQIANLWTRSFFAYKLGLDDLPQGVAFFSAVDIDHVLRKEVDMPCVTPSQPVPIPPGESVDIAKTLEKTHGGSLWPGGQPMVENDGLDCESSLFGYSSPDCLAHRANSAPWLRAQATSDIEEVRRQAWAYKPKEATAAAAAAKSKSSSKARTTRKSDAQRLKKVRALGDGSQYDWATVAEEMLKTMRTTGRIA